MENMQCLKLLPKEVNAVTMNSVIPKLLSTSLIDLMALITNLHKANYMENGMKFSTIISHATVHKELSFIFMIRGD